MPGPATARCWPPPSGTSCRPSPGLATALGLTVYSSPQLLDILDDRGGRRLDRLFQRLARELTAAETEALRVVTDPPGEGAALTARLLTAPTLAVELARRGVTVEVGVLAEAEFWSVYQPIVSLADRSVVAHEALLRGVVDGREVGGGDLFFVAEQAGWLHRLDRIGRESAIAGAVPWLGDDDLFINFNPTSIYRPQVCLASTERVVHETGIDPVAAGLRGGRVARDRRPRAPGLDPRPLPVAGLAGRPGRRRRRLVEPVAAGRRPARRRQARQGDWCRSCPDDGARTVLKAVTDLAHQLGAVVVAEGVETERLADEVTALGADLGQGWLFGRPVRPEPPVEEAESRWQPVSGVRRGQRSRCSSTACRSCS